MSQNNAPVNTRGPAIISNVDQMPNGLFQAHTTYETPNRQKRIPPIHSRRQETASRMRTRYVGTRCIRRAALVPQKPFPSLKTSRANRLMNRAYTTHNALGAQYNNCCCLL